MFGEKRYSRHGYEYIECPKCYGRGSESLSVFTKEPCNKCGGDGSIMVENTREMEVARHTQPENNEKRNAWLFS